MIEIFSTEKAKPTTLVFAISGVSTAKKHFFPIAVTSGHGNFSTQRDESGHTVWEGDPLVLEMESGDGVWSIPQVEGLPAEPGVYEGTIEWLWETETGDYGDVLSCYIVGGKLTSFKRLWPA